MGLFSPSPDLVEIIPSKHHGYAQLSARRLLVLRHGSSARLQGVAIIADYEPPVQPGGVQQTRIASAKVETRIASVVVRTLNRRLIVSKV